MSSRLCLGACAVMLAVAIAGPVPAAAAGSPPAAPRLMQPIGTAAPRSVTNGTGGFVRYEGGRVQHQPTVYLDYWGAAWSSGVADAAGYTGAQAQSYIETFLRAIGGSTWFSTQTQFCDGIQRGTTACDGMGAHVGAVRLGATWNDTGAPVASEAGVAAEAEAAAAHFGVQNTIDATVVVLTAAGQGFASDSGGHAFCAFHNYSADVIYAYLPWAPDQGAACGTNAVNATNDAFGHGHFDGISIALGGVVANAATDPQPDLPNGSGGFTSGWTDLFGFESGAKCAGLTAWPAHNVVFGAGSANVFAVQPLWSNSGDSCATENLGGGTIERAAMASWGPEHRDVFVRGLDLALWWKRWDGSRWSSWQSLGGRILSGPAAVSWGVGRTDVFAMGSDQALWHIAWTGSGWSSWQSLGGIIDFTPGAASWAAGGLDVVALGQDHGMWHLRWGGGAWSTWQPLGGGFSVPGVDAVSWRGGTDRLDIFGIGLDGQMWQKAWTGSSWSEWLPRGGQFVSAPAVTSTAPGRLSVFGLGRGFGLWRDTWDGSAWSGWSSFEGSWAGDPAAVSPPATGTVELTMVGIGSDLSGVLEACNVERLLPGP